MENKMALPSQEEKEIVAAGAADWKAPAFKVSGVFGSHMVLQRERPIRIRGFSDTPGALITGEFLGERVTATVGDDCRWTLRFVPHGAVWEGKTMSIYDDRGHSALLEDVLVGDVWLIGGQSNAEHNQGGCLDWAPEQWYDKDEPLRLFAQTRQYAFEHQDLCAAPQPDVICPDWGWQLPLEQAAHTFSAIGWFFGKELLRYIDAPVGLIMMAAGGACIRELMPAELAAELGYTTTVAVPLGGFYNSLIHPFVPLQFKGQIFFQGESEGCFPDHAAVYDRELAALVADERARFGHDFPFYNVQLSDYRDECATYFPALDTVRVKQLEALATIPGSTLTPAMDLGSPDNHPDFAHSPRKYELAMRIAKLALAREYRIGSEYEARAPKPTTAQRSADGRQITVCFTDIGDGLCVLGQSPKDSIGQEIKGFRVGPKGADLPARAVIETRGCVTVDVPEGADASVVSYAYSIRTSIEYADLRNGNNLPALAFCIGVD